jgi:hypothetical protein
MKMLSQKTLLENAPVFMKCVAFLSAALNMAIGAAYTAVPHKMMDMTGCPMSEVAPNVRSAHRLMITRFHPRRHLLTLVVS